MSDLELGDDYPEVTRCEDNKILLSFPFKLTDATLTLDEARKLRDSLTVALEFSVEEV